MYPISLFIDILIMLNVNLVSFGDQLPILNALRLCYNSLHDLVEVVLAWGRLEQGVPREGHCLDYFIGLDMIAKVGTILAGC